MNSPETRKLKPSIMQNLDSTSEDICASEVDCSCLISSRVEFSTRVKHLSMKSITKPRSLAESWQILFSVGLRFSRVERKDVRSTMGTRRP